MGFGVQFAARGRVGSGDAVRAVARHADAKGCAIAGIADHIAAVNAIGVKHLIVRSRQPTLQPTLACPPRFAEDVIRA